MNQPSTSTGTEIVALSASELSAGIHQKRFSCLEVMQAYLAQIDTHNPRVNALVSMRDHNELLEEAKHKDDILAINGSEGFLHGFPHAVKDLADAQGLITTHGSPIFKTHVAPADSIHVARIKQAGAIVIGKTNVPEFGLGSHTYNRVFGPTRNAFDQSKTAGGSSGGAAVGLAMRMLPVADGSDFMGSLRNPAAFNNVIGFRPTPGLVPLSDSYIEELACNGPMGRNVQDTAMLLSVLAGHSPASPSSLPLDPTQFTQPLVKDWNGTRIGWLGDLNGYLPMESGVLELCEKALGGFRTIGCRVENATLNYSMPDLWQTWLTLRHWLVRKKNLPLYANETLRSELKPELQWETRHGENLTADDVSRASTQRAALYHAVRGLFEHYDFLVLPSAQVFPFDVAAHWPDSIAGKTMDTYHRWMEVVIVGTLSGCPVINVPAGFSSSSNPNQQSGLPMGLQIISKRYADFAALQIAAAYEEATRWNLDYSPALLDGM